MADVGDADDEYYLPLQDQLVFGAGVRRKRIAFVPSSNPDHVDPQSDAVPVPPSSVASRYLSIVLPAASHQDNEPVTSKCAICGQPVSDAGAPDLDKHESSIAHQVCLEHSHPPSHLDQNHVGLKYLTTYGWDPNSRKGLGARGEGIRTPIKSTPKNDTVGLRETDGDEGDQPKRRASSAEKVVKLDARMARAKDRESRKRADRLRQSYYGPDVEKYLGPDG